MPFPARSAILHEIGTELQAGVLAYVTGDRENLETEVGSEVLRRVPRHLEAIGKPQPQQAQPPDELPVVLERAYIDTPTTCDSFVTRGVISRQPPAPAALAVTSERWEAMA